MAASPDGSRRRIQVLGIVAATLLAGALSLSLFLTSILESCFSAADTAVGIWPGPLSAADAASTLVYAVGEGDSQNIERAVGDPERARTIGKYLTRVLQDPPGGMRSNPESLAAVPGTSDLYVYPVDLDDHQDVVLRMRIVKEGQAWHVVSAVVQTGTPTP